MQEQRQPQNPEKSSAPKRYTYNTSKKHRQQWRNNSFGIQLISTSNYTPSVTVDPPSSLIHNPPQQVKACILQIIDRQPYTDYKPIVAGSVNVLNCHLWLFFSCVFFGDITCWDEVKMSLILSAHIFVVASYRYSMFCSELIVWI